MEPEHRTPYIIGLVDGLAYARFVSDGQETAGMNCINQWFYEQDGAIDQIYVAFDEFSDFPPGAVVSVLLNQVCG